MVLSDATIARCISEGRIEIDPYDAALLQPSNVDVRVDRLFRVHERGDKQQEHWAAPCAIGFDPRAR